MLRLCTQISLDERMEYKFQCEDPQRLFKRCLTFLINTFFCPFTQPICDVFQTVTPKIWIIYSIYIEK
jgi:hypothetical protein